MTGWGACASVVVVLVGLLSALPVAGQPNVVTATHPGGLMSLQVENPTIVSWYVSGTRHTWQRPGGRFRLLTGPTVPTGGDPTFTGDEGRAIASALTLPDGEDDSPYTRFSSKLTVAVAETYYDIHALGAAAGDVTGSTPVANFWVSNPTAGSRDIAGIAQIPLDDDDPNDATEFVEVEHQFTLIHDTLMVEYIVTNKSASTKPVGLRVLIDGRFGSASDLDGRSIFLPSGDVIATEKVIPDATTPLLPNTWVTMDRLSNPTVYLRGTIEGAEVHLPGKATATAGSPDQIGWGLMRNAGADAQWDFTPNSVLALDSEDWAYFVKWNQRDLAAGSSRRYVTFFGMGSSSADYDPSYALAAYAPATLEVVAGDDPSTPAVESAYLADSQGRTAWPVYAYVDNFYPSAIVDGSVRISLPSGLELDPESQPRSRSLGTVNRNEVKYVSWTVRAANARPGVSVIRFTGPQGKTVERSINIPALPMLTPELSVNGLEMVSIPYSFQNSDAEHVFQALGSLHAGGANALIKWDPGVADYRWFPDSFVTNVQPGEGFWLLNQNRLSVPLPADAAALDTTRGHTLAVYRGWNQIGNPFTGPIYWKDVRVIDSSGDEWTMTQAVNRGLILASVFSYDAANNEYNWQSELQNVRLDPYQGYWALCREDVSLQFPPPNLFAPADADESETGGTRSGWTAQLTVSGAGRVRSGRTFGVSSTAQDGVDPSDILAPPAGIANGVSLEAALVSGIAKTRMVQDIRQSGGRQEWTLAVSTSAASAPITVSWPDLSQVPEDLVLVFEDPQTGERRLMRTSAGYTFAAPQGGETREFSIWVKPRTAVGALVATANVVQAGRGATIAFTLAQDAEVDVQIRNIAGFPVKRVAAGKVASAGVNTELWDGRNDSGVRVPNGRYLCTVTARDVAGEQHSVVRAFSLAR